MTATPYGELIVRLREATVRKFADELRKWWSFDNGQMHTHSWHSREDFIENRLPELIDTALRDSLARSEWHPMDGAPQDETVFLAALWHAKAPYQRWEYALLWWTEGRLRFYDNETGWDPDEYTHYRLIEPPTPARAALAGAQP